MKIQSFRILLKQLLLLQLIFVFLFSSIVIKAQDEVSTKNVQTSKRPKIGLVLSGGGARGFAHIGVLKVLEENHIPIDYISGASMGALVGSMYATGRTPEEMEQLVQSLDWNKLLNGSTSYDKLSYRRKEDRRNIPGSVTLSGKGADLNLPNSLNPGHEIGLAIDNLFFGYSKINNFDDLPIPFRTVGTDMLNAETVVLKSGSLQQSLRATMSVPAVFAPVEINGKILADGGILNNIPTNLVKDMGADIVLVVNIETQIGDRSALNNLIGVLGQTFIIATVENSRRSLREADFIIAPDLKNYSSASFEQGKEIVELGYNEAAQKIGLIKSLSLNDVEWEQHLAFRRSRMIPASEPKTEFLAVEGDESSKKKEVVRDELGEKLVNKKVNKSEVEKNLTDLTGTNRFDSLGYELASKGDKEGLLIRVYDTKERTERNTNLQIGFEVNNTKTDTTNFNLRGRLTVFDFGGYGSEWRNDFSIGSRTLFATEFFRPINESKFFIAPNASYENRKVNFFVDGDRLAEYSFETLQIGLDGGYAVNRKNEVRLGLQFGHQKASRRIGDTLLPNLGGNFSNIGLSWNYDGADDSQIPTKGFIANNSLKYYFDSPGTTVGFPLAETRLNGFYPVAEKYTAFAFGAGGTSFRKNVSPIQQFTVGGLFNIGGYGSEEFRSNNYLRGGFGVLRETYVLPSYIGGKLYFGGWYEGGSAFDKLGLVNYRQSVTGGALLETPFGPIFVGGSFAEGGRKKLYFSLGKFF